MSKAARLTAITLGSALLTAAAGCGKTDSTYGTPPNTGTGMTGVGNGAAVYGVKDVGVGAASPTDPAAGGAPTYGDATGTGYHTGDAAHAGGQGSGLMGFHGTGAYGTSAAISDAHHVEDAPKGAPQWVLPEQ